jgi:hypothetical protein
VGGAVDERVWWWVGLGDAGVSHGCVGVVLGRDLKKRQKSKKKHGE